MVEDDDGRQMTKAGANRMMTALRAALNLAVEHNRVADTASQTWRAVKQHPKADGRREIFWTWGSTARSWRLPAALCMT